MEFWASQEFDQHEQVGLFSDPSSSLRAIIAIHSTALGPAVGGTRFKAYSSDAAALDDALRLSRAMSYKSALAGLPAGGGKAVIIGDPTKIKSRDLLLAYGRFVDRLGGLFMTGEDVGTDLVDVETIAEVTKHVGGTSSAVGDPSVHTAAGVIHGLHAVAERRFGRTDLAGLTVGVQGLGAVGWDVARRLHEAGAKLVVSDIAAERVAAAVAAFAAVPEPTEMIHRAKLDIFTPCALGGIITEQSAAEIQAAAVAGAANNQLATSRAGKILAERDILFAPDYLINAGGIISGLHAASVPSRLAADENDSLGAKLLKIRHRLTEIFEQAAQNGLPPEVAAEDLARSLIKR